MKNVLVLISMALAIVISATEAHTYDITIVNNTDNNYTVVVYINKLFYLEAQSGIMSSAHTRKTSTVDLFYCPAFVEVYSDSNITVATIGSRTNVTCRNTALVIECGPPVPNFSHKCPQNHPVVVWQ
jgi:DMSO reductase anchor subunit